MKLAYDNVEKWIKPQNIPFGMNWFAMKPRLVAEAKGVVLIISPFNVPLFLTMTPLVSSRISTVVERGCRADLQTDVNLDVALILEICRLALSREEMPLS